MTARRHLVRRAAVTVAVAYVAYVLFVLFLLPPVARHMTQSRLRAILGRPVTVGSIHLNPFTFCFQVREFEIWEPNGKAPFAGVERLEVNFSPLLSLLQRGLVVSSVTVDSPHAILVRRGDRSFNFSDLFGTTGQTARAKQPAGSSGLPRFSVSNIRIRGGWFFFRDEVVNARQSVTGLELAIPALSSLPTRTEIYVQPAFRANLNGRRLALDSQAKPFAASRASAAGLHLHDLNLTAFAPYLPEPRNFDFSSGRLDIDLDFKFAQTRGGTSTVSLAGDIGLRDIRVAGRDGRTGAGLAALRLTILPTDLMQKELHVSSILCRAPVLRVVRDAKGALVLPHLGAEGASSVAPTRATAGETVVPPATVAASTGVPPATASLPFTVNIDAIQIQDGRLEFTDDSVKPVFQTALDFDVDVTGLTTRPEHSVQVRFQSATESAETIAGRYSVTLFPSLAITGATAFADVQLAKYMPYLGLTLAGAITRGTLGVRTDHAFALPAGAPPVVKIDNLCVVISNFCLTAATDQVPVVAFQDLIVAGVSADLGAREAVVGSFATHGGQFNVQRFGDGSLNLQKVIRGSTNLATAAQPAAVPAAQPAPVVVPWVVTVRDAAVGQWAVALEDRQPVTPVFLAVRDITTHITDLTTRAGRKGTLALDLKLNEGGGLAVAGGFQVNPPAVDLGVKLTDLALKDFQGYVGERLKLLVNDGAAETDLKVVVGQAADAGFEGTVDGSFALRRFASVDQAHAEDLVKCRELALRGIHFVLRPMAARVDEVTIDGLATALAFKPDGTLNLLAVLGAAGAPVTNAPPPAATATATTAAEKGGNAFPLEIGTIRLQGCGVTFTDQQQTPNYRVTLGDLAGTVTSLSLGKPTPAQIDLRGRFDGHAPFTVKATLTDLGRQMTLTLASNLKDFDISRLTPYSGRYVGYAVRKGKFNFDLQYTLDKRQLTAENKILIDQFGFGQKIESPDAVKLPVRLAVALLKDRKGQINLDVPLRGSLDDPSFSVLRLVLHVVGNLVTRAATAPFSMLASLVGGGSEELSAVDFAPGSVELDAAGTNRLAILAKALVERPELEIEIGGTVDLATDREGLARRVVVQQVKSRRLADLIEEGKTVGSLDDVPLSAADRDKYLVTIYRERIAPPRPLLSLTSRPKEPTPAEIEQVLVARVNLTDADVGMLAGQRAASVRKYLTTVGGIEAARVFVLDTAPSPTAESGGGSSPARQARMSLR